MNLESAVRHLRDKSRVGNREIDMVTMHPTVYKLLTEKDAGDLDYVTTVDGIKVYIDSIERPHELHGYTREDYARLQEIKFVNEESGK